MVEQQLVIDIGGEGRHAVAWNINPSTVKTFGPEKGRPIPRLIPGRSDAIPLPDKSAAVIIVERTPISLCALDEIRRIARDSAVVILRHFRAFGRDPHYHVKDRLSGPVSQRTLVVGNMILQETVIEVRTFDEKRLIAKGEKARAAKRRPEENTN